MHALWNAQELLDHDSYPTSPALVPGYRRFSTRGLSALDRIELWESHNAEALVSLGCRSIDGEPLDAVEVNLLLPQLTFAKVTANAHVVERDNTHIAATRGEGVALYFSLAGDTFFYHQDGVHLQRPGTLLVCDINQPFMRGFAKGLQEYVLTVPRDVFETVAERSLPESPLIMNFSDVPHGDLNAASLARLIQRSLADPRPESLAATERSAMDLLQALFTGDRANSPAGRRRAAIAWISRHLREPSLSVTAVAEGIRVSERQLSRAFAETDRGVARTILDMRLELAHRVLTDRSAPSVEEAARYCGFASASHFCRVFRARFGRTPGDVRASAVSRA